MIRVSSSSGANGWTSERSVAGNHNPWAIVAVISIATFMTVLDTSIVLHCHGIVPPRHVLMASAGIYVVVVSR
jgi:hypothetical protein